MAFIPAAATVEVFMEHQVNGKSGVGWVLHYRSASTEWDLLAMNDLALQLRNWWNTEIENLVHPATRLERIRLRNISSANGAVLDYTTGLPITGSGSAAGTPNNVSFSLKKNTGLAGKSFRGRVYLLGLTEAAVNGNFLDAAVANLFVDAFNEALILVGAEDTYAMALVSKYSNNAPRASALVNNVSSFSYSDLRIDTRRDRL